MWLINSEWRARLERAYTSDWYVTSDIQSSFDKRRADAVSDVVVAADGVARIDVIGPLTKNPDPFIAFFLGANTAFTDINDQVNAAVANPGVESIEFFVDSPGGMVDGLFETLDTIAAAREQKPMTVRADNAHSAAFAIAAAAGHIQATSRGSMFGSIGVATSIAVNSDVVDLTSTEAPDKRPDVTTQEGRDTVVAQLDAIHALFVESIATGRSASPEAINKGFGRGASFVASDALDRGMIDGIAQPSFSVVSGSVSASNNTSDNSPEKCKVMDLKELKAQEPSAYDAAVAEGVQQERDRVCAHLTYGRQSGDLDTAFAAIESGEGITMTIQAKYFAAGINKRDRDDAQADSDAVGAVVEGAETASQDESDLGLQTVALVEELLGKGKVA